MTDVPAPAATAVRAIIAALVRHAITATGAALVARGYADQATVDGASGPLADYLVGGGMILSSAAWAWGRARLTHTRWARAWAMLNGPPDASSQ